MPFDELGNLIAETTPRTGYWWQDEFYGTPIIGHVEDTPVLAQIAPDLLEDGFQWAGITGRYEATGITNMITANRLPNGLVAWNTLDGAPTFSEYNKTYATESPDNSQYPFKKIEIKEEDIMKYFEFDETNDHVFFINFINPKSDARFKINISNKKDNLIDIKTFIKKILLCYSSKYSENDLSFIKDRNYRIRDKATVDTYTIALSQEILNTYIGQCEDNLVKISNLNKGNLRNLKESFDYEDVTNAAHYIRVMSESDVIYNCTKAFREKLICLADEKEDTIFVADCEKLKNGLYNILQNIIRDNTDNNPDAITKQYKLNNLGSIDPEYNKTVEAIYANLYAQYSRRSANSKNTIAMTKLRIEKKTYKTIELSLELLYPDLDKHIASLMYNYCKYFVCTNTEYYWDGIDKTWNVFNEIKTNLILLGMNEKNSVEYILTKAFNNKALNTREDTHKNITVATCELTKQLVPSIFIVDCTMLNKVTLPCNIYFLQIVSNKNTPRYIDELNIAENKKVWREIELLTTDYYRQSTYYHSKSALEFLSPKASANENTKVYDKEKVYDPIPYLGVELEIERQKGCREDITEEVLNSLGRDFVILKTDGSLQGHNPFEIVSVPATLQCHKERWYNFMNATSIKSQLQSFKNGSCGMHVHISRDAFTGLHLAKFMRFINSIDNRKFIIKIAQRDSNRYCEYTDYETVTHKGKKLSGLYGASRRLGSGDYKHYDAVNTVNKHTIEVRIFRGNLAKGHFYKNIEFVHALWAYTKNCSMKDLDYKDFILWTFKENCKHYSNLQQWLVASGFNVSNRNDLTDENIKKEIAKIRLVVNRKFNTKDSENVKKIGKDKFITKTELLANG